jgi:hypothetical protein
MLTREGEARHRTPRATPPRAPLVPARSSATCPLEGRRLKAVRTPALATAVTFPATPAHADSPYDPSPAAWHEPGETYLATSRYGYEPFAAPDGYIDTKE